MTYRERRALRAERLAGWSSTNERKADRTFDAAHDAIAGIPPGQPILVGHHSERHHRRDLARHDSRMRKAIELQDKSRDQAHRADTITHQLETSIYDDDPDALDQLNVKLEELEARRARIHAVNKAIRKWGYPTIYTASVHMDTSPLNPPLSQEEVKELTTLIRVTPYHEVEKRGFPPYATSNLSNLITKTRQRIARLSGSGTKTPANPDADTARDRAGLIITKGMTTPSRPGKKPRPVWTVTGNLGPHRAMLGDLGGSWYRAAFSFWEDPTEAIEDACRQRETR